MRKLLLIVLGSVLLVANSFALAANAPKKMDFHGVYQR